MFKIRKFLWYTLEIGNPWLTKKQQELTKNQGFMFRLYERCICGKHQWLLFDYTKYNKHLHLYILGIRVFNNRKY